MNSEKNSLIAWLPELLYTDGEFRSGWALVCDSSGMIVKVAPIAELRDEKRTRLANRAMLPGMINAHSHAFQRVLRGRTEHRTGSHDNFWIWREMMYSAAMRLTPEDVYDASRMAFMEMALAGITSIGEFHYLHHATDGTPYDDANVLAKEVIRAANELGLRIALLRVAYARSGFQTEPNRQQLRFIENDSQVYLSNLEALAKSVNTWTRQGGEGRKRSVSDGAAMEEDNENRNLPNGRVSDMAWIGIAPHSVRAVPLDYLCEVIAYAKRNGLKCHMHVAEQQAEVSACVEEYGRTPFALLETEGLLNENFTAVHAIHVTPKTIPSFAKSGAIVCACPTTERSLGDGVVPADEYMRNGVAICLGTDSQAQIDLLEDARELEYHLRLQKLERAILDGGNPTVTKGASSLNNESRTLPHGRVSAMLFDCATINGAGSIGAASGSLEIGKPADFFTVDLSDPSIAGASSDDLLSSIVFSGSRAAIREVVVGGKPIVSEGQHLMQEEVVDRFSDLQRKLWG